MRPICILLCTSTLHIRHVDIYYIMMCDRRPFSVLNANAGWKMFLLGEQLKLTKNQVAVNQPCISVLTIHNWKFPVILKHIEPGSSESAVVSVDFADLIAVRF